MSTTMARERKGKKTGDGKEDDRSGRRTAPIQVEKELARWAAVIASHRGITQSELVSPHLRQFLRTQYELVKLEIQKELGEQPDQKPAE